MIQGRDMIAEAVTVNAKIASAAAATDASDAAAATVIVTE